MYQIDVPSAAPALPVSTISGQTGYFTDGNPATGNPATIVPAEFLNSMMLELIHVLKKAGVTPDKATFDQIANAIFVSPAFSGVPTAPTAAADNDTTQIATTAFVQQITQKLIIQATAGQIGYFPSKKAPEGWLKANGAVIDNTVYQNLSDVIYVGDELNATSLWGYRCRDKIKPNDTRDINGQYTVLPDLRGEFLRCFDDGKGIDKNRVFGSVQDQTFQSHEHPINDPQHTHGVSDPGHSHTIPSTILADKGYLLHAMGYGKEMVQYDTGPKPTNISIASSATGITIQAAGGEETRPRNMAFLACIKY